MTSSDDKKALTDDDTIGLIVHAYNNFLSGMMGYSELTLLECDNPSQVKHLNLSLESGNEAVHFGKVLLASIGRLQIDLKPYRLDELFQGLVGESIAELDFVDLERNKNIIIKTEKTWFQECFNDLLRFISASTDNPKIKINLDDNAKTLKILIDTENFLISDEDINNLFLPFYSSRKMLGEKDVGLSKAKGFFSQMNAELSWENERGFVLEVPIEK